MSKNLFPSIESKKMLTFVKTSVSVVENIGVEPMTSCVQGRRSSQLS